jgi:membrane protein implicated in regulation of membrane protease activity
MKRRSVFTLARQLIAEVIGLAKLELQHGRQEIGVMLAGAKRGAILIGIALGLIFMALIALVAALIFGLAALTGLPDWAMALIVFVALLLVAALFGYRGARRIRVGPPTETIASVKEEIAWAKRLTRRG